MPGAEPRPENREEFARLFLEVERDLYRYVCALLPRPQDVQDVLQETALALWQCFDAYDPSRSFLPWALRFALNKARQHARREGRLSLLLRDDVLAEKIAREQESNRSACEDQCHRLRDCLSKLPPRQAGIVRAYYWNQESAETVASKESCSLDAFYKRLQRTRLLLMDCIQRQPFSHTSPPPQE